MKEGWIKLHRSTLENAAIMKDGDHLALWSYLLMSAVYIPTDVMFGGKRITLLPGQFTTGRQKMATDSHINESKIERILKLFKSEQQIEQRTDRQCRLITIKNWDRYQDFEQRNEQQVNNDRTTSEQRVNTNKEYKEVKKEKNIRNTPIVPSGDIAQIINFFNSTTGVNVKCTDGKVRQLTQRLKSFSVEEIKKAISSRMLDPWQQGSNKDGKVWCKDWDSLFRNDEKIDQWLNYVSVQPITRKTFTPKPFDDD